MTTWHEAVRGAGATAPDDAITAAGADVEARWAEPHRRYHTTAHLHAVLSNVDTLAAQADDPDLVRLAAWFHDAVYDPRARRTTRRPAPTWPRPSSPGSACPPATSTRCAGSCC